MISTKNLRAARKFGPGYFIKEQMEIRGWVQEELADILGISLKHLNSILMDKQPITIENAIKLSVAFRTSPQYWLNLDSDYRLWLEQAGSDQTEAVVLKSNIYSHMPVRDMMRKGWIENTQDAYDLSDQVQRFWGIDRLDFTFLDQYKQPFLCKKSSAFNQFNASYAATWFQMAKTFSKTFECSLYNKKALVDLYSHLAGFTTRPSDLEVFINELNSCGVKFFVLPHLEKTYLDGAAFLFDGSPVIVYTARFNRIDNFWFTMAHEIAHVLNHLNSKLPYILDNLNEKCDDSLEIEANDLAAKHLKHDEILQYLNPYLNYLTRGKIEECARRVDIHPAIITGALAFNKSISFRNINLYKDNVLNYIPKEFVHPSVG